jgi:aryl-alcohol dehydrogenase-like predicted oxidoreductase
MVKVTLGSTGITVNKNGFGALPIQRISHESSTDILRRAYEAGIDFYDTARFYTDSECKLGEALSDVREHIYKNCSKKCGRILERPNYKS